MDALKQLDLNQSGRLKEVRQLTVALQQKLDILSNCLDEDSYTGYPSERSLKAAFGLLEAASQLNEHVSIHMKIKKLELYQQEKPSDVPSS